MMTITSFNPMCITYSQMNMIFNARIYYRRLVAWTRAYLISRYNGVGTAEELFGRLYLESLDIGNMLQIIFGREYSDEYSQLLSQYAITLREVIDAQLAGNTEAASQGVARLYSNVADRSAYLESINPYWTAEGYKALLGTYTQYVLEMANALAAQDYQKDIELYDRLNEHTNRMGDVFAEGLFDYITSGAYSATSMPPEGQGCITYGQMDLIFSIRMFWFELAIWVRNYMLSRYLGLGNVEQTYARLRQVPVDYTDTLRMIFGDEVSDSLLEELNLYIDLLSQFITAQMAGDTDEVGRITQLLYQNADRRAALIASVNPFWTVEEWKSRLYNNLRMTLDESTTFLIGDYARNIDIYSRLLDLAESTANYFAQGLFSYLYQQNQELEQYLRPLPTQPQQPQQPMQTQPQPQHPLPGQPQPLPTQPQQQQPQQLPAQPQAPQLQQ